MPRGVKKEAEEVIENVELNATETSKVAPADESAKAAPADETVKSASVVVEEASKKERIVLVRVLKKVDAKIGGVAYKLPEKTQQKLPEGAAGVLAHAGYVALL